MKRIVCNSIIFVSFFFLLFSNFICAQYFDEPIGETWYDLQSNAATQNRIYLFTDGTIGATWIHGLESSSGFYDLGTGYNYFDGNSWDSIPSERIESDRSGWPSYAPLGENGEIVVSHFRSAAIDGLCFSKRINKGVGVWEESYFFGPPGYEDLLWPRMVTGGENNNHIYLIAITRPIPNGGSLYEGIDGSILYSRSTDAGLNWDQLYLTLPGMDSSWYKTYDIDAYAWAEPHGNNITFVVGSYNHDLFIMKSSDYGATFEKTIIWDHPFDHGNPIIPMDTFYCPDGAVSVALDMQGMAHVAFGISKMYFNNDYSDYRFIDVDGLAYWNEGMNTFSSDYNALNPYGHPDSELEINKTLIGWCQDVDGDSIVSLIDVWGYYRRHGMTSMPQIVIDEQNRIFVGFCSVTETYQNGLMNYRRLWLRNSNDSGVSWSSFYHYGVDDPATIYNEYAFPSFAANSDENLYLIYMTDNEPGLHQEQGGGPYGMNHINFAKIPKDEVVGIIKEPPSGNLFSVSQNFPNPFTDKSRVEVTLAKPGDIKLYVRNMLGQIISEREIENSQKGKNQLILSARDLNPGIYFYTIKSGEFSITKKMIVK